MRLADLILLPVAGPIKLVIIEAKARASTDAAAKVVGQLLMYYAGALMLGESGLRFLREYAANNTERARSLTKISPKALTGGLSPGDRAWRAMYAGPCLRPEEIALFVALDGGSHRALAPTLTALSKHHGLTIGFCVVEARRVDCRIPIDFASTA